ncbi:hypothetical protein [Halorubrum salsamenti]|nr:hypothetical protein [Halorubrum salsamenti]
MRRRGLLRKSAGLGAVGLAAGTAVIWGADATHYVDDRSVAVEPR